MEVEHHNISSLAAQSQLKIGSPYSFHQFLYVHHYSLLIRDLNHCHILIKPFSAGILFHKGKISFCAEFYVFLTGQLPTRQMLQDGATQKFLNGKEITSSKSRNLKAFA